MTVWPSGARRVS